MLPWYDKAHRNLPWRAEPGDKPNPYYVLLSEVMLQQTTVPTVIPYFNKFITRWPTLEALSSASLDDIYHYWQGLGYYSRAKNLHKCAKILMEQFHEAIPASEKVLLTLPGIGPYTAAAISAIAFEQPAIPVDGNIIRIFSRLKSFKTPLPALKKIIFEEVKNHISPHRRGDMAQSFMDLGTAICQPKQPKCSICPLFSQCKGAAEGIAAQLPYRVKKPEKPTKYGVVYWYQTTDGQILIAQRPETGLLANLMEIPSTPWALTPHNTNEISENSPLKSKNHYLLPIEVSHTFTHFHLKLKILKAVLKNPLLCTLKRSKWVHIKDLEQYAFPTLMKKVVHAVMNHNTKSQIN